MSMQTDILASRARTDDGQLLDQAGNTIGRCRVRSIYIVPDSSAGSGVFRDGGATGPVKLTLPTMASTAWPAYLLLPAEGLLFQSNIYVDVTTITSVMVFYS